MQIRLRNIHPHPDNPRKRIGDIEELTNSIRSFGLLQNLTVVPIEWDELTIEEKKAAEVGEDQYRVVCGHRRLAAAAEAGIDSLNCNVLEDMSREDQVATMLMENMQRDDLTVQEEAQGFQLMLNLGKSIQDICDKTGFSESKIRHRMKLNELDQEKLQKRLEDSNISIMDLQKLETIKSNKLRNEVLESIGTTSFGWKVKEAQLTEQKQAVRDKIQEEFGKHKEENGYGNGVIIARINYIHELDDWAEFLGKCYDVECMDDLRFGFGYDSVNAWIDQKKDVEESEEDKAAKEKAKQTNEKIALLREKVDQMYDFWNEFVSHISERTIKDNLDDLIDTLNREVLTRYSLSAKEKILELIVDKYDDVTTAYNDVCTRYPVRVLFVGTFITLKPYVGNACTWTPSGRYSRNPSIEKMYEFLTPFGYQMSDDERAIINGTSELYVNE